jgi:hypothetical protein
VKHPDVTLDLPGLIAYVAAGDDGLPVLQLTNGRTLVTLRSDVPDVPALLGAERALTAALQLAGELQALVVDLRTEAVDQGVPT